MVATPGEIDAVEVAVPAIDVDSRERGGDSVMESKKKSRKERKREKKERRFAEKQRIEEALDPAIEFAEPSEEHNEQLKQKLLQDFREWVKLQPHFVNCRTDDSFLLRFLRTRKYCLQSAQDTLDRYLTVRTHYPIFFKNPDLSDKGLRDILSRGYLFPLMEKDPEGRTIVFGLAGALDTSRHKPNDIYRAFSLTFEALLEDEVNQRKGFTYILDESGFRLHHLAHVNLRDVQRVMISGEKGYPMRHKSIHWVNVPRYISALTDFVLSFFSPKLQKRMFVHTDVNSLHKEFDPKILPLEFGGSVPWKIMCETWLEELERRCPLIMSMDEMGVDEKLRPKESKCRLGGGSGGWGFMKLWTSLTRVLVISASPETCPDAARAVASLRNA
ncbi:clavesin-2-like isoform X1 [Varroa jacobsoni]|uniref:clavesin-2-like isoform X1 n=1 Tax=Varroa jacobsoni TaxID=62625 RepID=UPI000BFA95BE|nr:clavesin-2-like isoform X1 [Varroa jacobsoni]XP_022693176.1 clavesin-2-like isoform X1 [Varroa jacobsoni]XP_022693177.1 clavesin-2-like isoform X1 [Varroa jacobsoni]XP_022693178.1 clavesin-2-like isoform X1 [Varroa jacobsoni]XP_022693179.1 clavesin-2-like isoform X1 [Varroa jacobsoni]